MFGIRNQVVVLDLGYSIEVTRRRILVENRGVTFERSLADTLICHRQFGLIQYVRVEPPARTTLPVRHLLEFVAWTSARPKGGLMRELTWHVREVTDSGAKIDLVAHEVLVQEAGSVWPCPSLPAEIEQGATFRMLSTGEVHWEIAGEAPRQGLIASAR